MFLALAYLLPFLTGQIPKIGAMLCPMHLPVLLCGFFCGAPYGLIVGALAPLLRSVIMGRPVLFPAAVCMAFELAAYGYFTGFFYRIFPKKKPYVFVSLIGAMLLGRLIWGVAQFVCLGFGSTQFGMDKFLAGAFFNAIPGIIIQLILVPALIFLKPRTNE